jgi:glutamate dehydrogenase (NADP+)
MQGVSLTASYGLVYYVTEMLRDLDNTDWKGKKVLISGSGNVAQYAALKVIELGGIVLTLSGSLVATSDSGFTPEEITKIADLKLQRKSLTAFDVGSKFKWHESKRPWTLVASAGSFKPS